MAIRLEGNWKTGIAFDLHTVASTLLGVDEFGHDRFDNTRSEMGELVYQLKYRHDRSVVPRIIELLDSIQGIENFHFILPIPPTNKERPFQPVEIIAEALGQRRNVAVILDALSNEGTEELKGVTDPIARQEMLQQSITLKENFCNGAKVLLIDDLYRSGATLRSATRLLYEQAQAQQVSVLTMTKTRSHR